MILVFFPTIRMRRGRRPALVKFVRVEVGGGVVGGGVVEGAGWIVQVARGGRGHYSKGPMET